MTALNGQCLCGAVRFHGTPVPGRGIGVCHCGQCRRWASGPFMAIRMTGGVTFDADEALVWHRSSDHGERGFCGKCGTSLFWRAPGAGNDVAVNVSALPEDHGQAINEHIWVDDKPDFYDFSDDAPRLTAAQAMAGS
jgi:hypothetical protein